MCPIAKANKPNKIHNFLFFSLTYLKPRKTSPKNPKNKPITVNILKKKQPFEFKQKHTTPKATKNKDAMPLKIMVLKEQLTTLLTINMDAAIMPRDSKII